MKYLLVFFAVLSSYLTHAQGSFGFAEATITYKRGDSMVCLVKREVNFGEVITYKVHQDADETQVGTSYIKSIRIGSTHFESIPIGKKEKLSTLIISGKTTLFTYVESQAGQTLSIPNSNGRVTPFKITVHYIAKNGDKYSQIEEDSFEKDLKKIVSDCPTILADLDNHVYIFRQVPEVIKQYNICKN